MDTAEERNKVLEAENGQLSNDIDSLKQEIASLKAQIAEHDDAMAAEIELEKLLPEGKKHLLAKLRK